MGSHWHRSFKADPRARALADRHYNRQKVGAAQFVPPGKCVVLVTRDADAFWVTSAPLAQYVRHAWAGAWVCSAFRNEGPVRSSLLIREAVAVTRQELGEPPALGMVTFVDPSKVRTSPAALGWCYRKAGFRHVGATKGGLLAFQMLPHDMPEPMEPGPLVLPDGTIQAELSASEGGARLVDADALLVPDERALHAHGLPADLAVHGASQPNREHHLCESSPQGVMPSG